ncbi:hypothetical protein EDF70_10915 [Neorhizobium sp. JUb45]|nr:hypothetical protein EDF70_10915 [Neorhizobium sp. JUb45]
MFLFKRNCWGNNTQSKRVTRVSRTSPDAPDMRLTTVRHGQPCCDGAVPPQQMWISLEGKEFITRQMCIQHMRLMLELHCVPADVNGYEPSTQLLE